MAKSGFRFPKRKKRNERFREIPVIRPRPQTTPEGLTGSVRGYAATDIEERFARALYKLEIPFWFQYELKDSDILPGYEKKVDFLIFYAPGRTLPMEIYGLRWHGTAGDRDFDLQRETAINKYGRRYGWDDLEILWEYQLFNQLAADNEARRLFL